jgi:hypothetical protein
MPVMMRVLSFLAGVLLAASVASAQMGDIAFSGGWSHLYPQRSSGLNFSKDGAYLDSDFAWRAPGQVPLMFGFGLTWNGTWSSTNEPFVIGNNFLGSTWLYSDIDSFAFEPRMALKFRIPGIPGLEIRPRIGAGPLYSYYAIDSAQVFNNGVFVTTAYHSGAAFEVRPDLQVGYGFGGTSFGMDVSYSAAWGSFGSLGDEMQELRVGMYVRFKY